MAQRARRKLTPEQKATTVAIVKTSGKPIAQLARELDLSKCARRTRPPGEEPSGQLAARVP